MTTSMFGFLKKKMPLDVNQQGCNEMLTKISLNFRFYENFDENLSNGYHGYNAFLIYLLKDKNEIFFPSIIDTNTHDMDSIHSNSGVELL